MERYKVVEASLLPPDFPDTWPEPLVEVVKAADAQATIAALQARVKVLEAEVDTLTQQEESWESQLTQRTAELEAANQRVAAMQATVTQTSVAHQAESERVRGERDALQSQVDGWELGSRGFP